MGLRFPKISIDSAPRRVQNSPRAGDSHGLHHVVGEQRPFPEVDVRLAGGTGDVGVRSQMDDGVVPVHGGLQTHRLLHVAAHHAEARILQMCRVVPFTPGDRKSTRLNSSHLGISYAVFCLKTNIALYTAVPVAGSVCAYLAHSALWGLP